MITTLPNPTSESSSSGPQHNAIIFAQTGGKYHYPKHKTPYLIASNFINKGNYSLNGSPIQISEKYFYFLNKNDEFEIRFKENNQLQTLLILFNEEFLKSSLNYLTSDQKQLLDEIEKPLETLHVPAIPFNLNKRIQQRIALLLRQRISPEETDSQLFALIKEFASVWDKTAKEVRKVNAIKRSTQLEMYKRLFLAREFINDNAKRRLSLETVANQVCLNKFHFLEQFKALFNTTPHQYLTEIRLQKAHEMLASGKHSVSEVCFGVGFESSPSFSNLFKRRFQATPAAVIANSK